MKLPRMNEVFLIREMMDPIRRKQVEDQIEVVPIVFGTGDDEFQYDDLEQIANQRGLKEGPGGHYSSWWYDPKEWDETTDVKELDGKNPDHIISIGQDDEAYLIGKGARAKRYASDLNDPKKNYRLMTPNEYGEKIPFVNDDGTLDTDHITPGEEPSKVPDFEDLGSESPKKSSQRSHVPYSANVGKKRRLAHIQDVTSGRSRVFGRPATTDEIEEVLGISSHPDWFGPPDEDIPDLD